MEQNESERQKAQEPPEALQKLRTDQTSPSAYESTESTTEFTFRMVFKEGAGSSRGKWEVAGAGAVCVVAELMLASVL